MIELTIIFCFLFILTCFVYNRFGIFSGLNFADFFMQYLSLLPKVITDNMRIL